MRTFLRILFLIPIGLMAAIAVAVAVYLAAFGFRTADLWGGPDGSVPVGIAPVLVLLDGLSQGALLPFLAAILLSEIFAIRSFLAWTLFGGALGVGLHLFAFPGNMEILPPLAAGFCAGFAYWLIAGRGAGVRSAALSDG